MVVALTKWWKVAVAVFSAAVMVWLGIMLSSRTKPQEECSVEGLIAKIDSCPPWANLDLDDKRSVSRLLATMDELRKCDYDALREAIRRYVAWKEADEDYSVKCMSRLFLLNRLLFHVPEE